MTDREVKKGEIFLSDTEIRDIKELNKKYAHFMLVLNTGGVVDLSPLDEVNNILILSQLGVETGSVLADIILGNANPSGKLTTTWSAWEDYPDLVEFGGYDETRYKEGIYVGYRYFDSVSKTPLFPFGYGLSYSNFEISKPVLANQNATIELKVNVKNTGAYKGKETVQLYVSVPAGNLDQPYQVLAAFGKTRELNPGQDCQVTLSFDMSETASFDEERAVYLLETGRYFLRVGNSSRDTAVVGVIELNQEVITRKVKNCLGKPDFKDFVPDKALQETVSNDITRIQLTQSDFETEIIQYNKSSEVAEEVKILSDEEILHLAMGHFDPKGGLTGVVGNAGSLVAGSAGETAHVEGMKPLIMADGPAGLRIAKEYFVDKKGVHSMAAPMPESMMAFASGIMKFFLNRATAKPKKKKILSISIVLQSQ